jgi:hypothetical protein
MFSITLSSSKALGYENGAQISHVLELVHGHLSNIEIPSVTNVLRDMLAQGQTQGSTLQQRTNKTLTTGPFGNTCEADEVSPEVEAGVVAGLRCLQP